MTTKSASRQKVKKLSVDWDPEIHFTLAPKAASAAKRRLLKRLLKSCTIAISMRKLPAYSPKPFARVEL